MTFKTTKLRDAITFALATGATAIAGIGVASAQEAQEEQSATTLERIEVTGSRIKRTDVETSQPILSLSRDEIQAQGLTSVGDVIQNISTNGSTLNTTFNNGGNGETRVNLRNLGSNRTLVLVNGRRWVGGTGLGGAVDLNTIPTAAVERIEVLKDGASTIYGSDAIAGVVNVILRRDFEGAEANAYIGQFDKGDGTRQAYDFTIGSSSDRWSAMLGVGYVKEEPVFAGDREISAVPLFGASPGFGGSSTTPDGTFCFFDFTTNPANGNPFGCRLPDNNLGQFTAEDNSAGWRSRSAVDNYNFAPDNYLITPQERVSLFTNASLDLTDSVRFRTTINYNERRSEQLLAAMPVVLGVPNGDDTVISALSIYNPFGRDVNWIQRRINETGGRSFNQDVDTFAFDGGFEGFFDIGDRTMDWELGYFYGENEQVNTTFGLFQRSKLANALGPSAIDANGNPFCYVPGGDPADPLAGATVIDGCVPLDVLSGAGTITPEMLEYISFTAQDQFGYQQKTYYGNIGGDLFDLPGGPLAFSFGIEHREEEGFDLPDALINSGDTTGNARTATSGSYSLDEAYLEFAIPVLSEVPGAQLLDFSVATRYSDYSNFGTTLNSKFGFRWKPIDDLLIRGNWSEGFRAPAIGELFAGQADSFPNLNDPCAGTIQGEPNTDIPARCATDGVPQYAQTNTQVRITVGGNPDLGPESSTTQTLGFVYSPGWIEGLDVSLDWWKIEIEDAIFTISGQGIADFCYRNNLDSFCDVITRDATGQIVDLLALPANIGTIETEGYDMTVGYRIPETAWGRFSLVWDTTYTSETFVDINGDGRVTEDRLTGEGGNLVGEYSDRNNNWRIRSNLSTRWEMGDWGATWNVRYYSPQDELCSGTLPASQIALVCSDPDKFTSLDGDDPDTAPDSGIRAENRIGSRFYHDASVYTKTPWNGTVALGINNILDKDPPFSATTFANSFDPQYEIPGRFYYIRYTQRF